MSISTQQLSTATLVSDGTTSTGTVNLSTYTSERRRVRIMASVSGGTATIKVRTGLDSARTVDLQSTSSVGSTGVVYESDKGPWPYLDVAWSSNTGTVRIDVQAWDGF